MDDLLNQLMTTDDDKEVGVLLRKAAYVIQRSAGNAGALRSGDYNSCSRVAGGQDADDKEYIVYIANSLVTLLLYYINDVKVLRPATDALVALTGKFQWLKEVMGQAGLHHNLIGPLKQQIKAQYGRSNEATSYAILECIMELYLVMTYGSHDNLQRCKETSLIGMLVPQFDDRHASLQLCLTNLKLLSFMISASELGEGAETSKQLRCTWRQRCLLHERSWSIVTVDDDNTPIEHESEASILSRVLWIMNSFLIDTTDIQLYGLMCLSSFLVEAGGHQLLWLGGAFDSALHACFFYVGCLEVQQHAFLFMRNLLFRLLCSDEQTGEIPLANVLGSKYDMISQVVGCALHTYFHSDDIMISVCDIIKVLLLASDGLGERMIYDGLPRTLMQMLPQQKRADSNYLNGSVVATNDVRQHILSCIHLFASNRKN